VSELDIHRIRTLVRLYEIDDVGADVLLIMTMRGTRPPFTAALHPAETIGGDTVSEESLHRRKITIHIPLRNRNRHALSFRKWRRTPVPGTS